MLGAVKRALKRASGADRPRVIAVIGTTVADVEQGVAHALTSQSEFPIRAWSADAIPPGHPGVSGCELLTGNAGAAKIRRDLAAFWPALVIVTWSGERRAFSHKLLPFTVPPFRIVIANEAGGFFPAKPRAIAEHLGRRFRDAARSAATRLGQWSRAFVQLLGRVFLQALDRLRSLLLALLGVLAKPTAGMVRPFILRLTTAAAASQEPLAPARACGDRYAEVVVSGRAFRRGEVMRALSSGVDFLVFRRLGETALPEPLIELARQTGAFAVARQTAYAGWRKTVITRHPFRRLQPGEATLVTAPWSTLLVLRTDMLGDVGVPSALTFGGALAVLFRRAAAAGLRCLTVGAEPGHEAAITQEPAMELEDAELALQLACSASLRTMAPRFPHRSRGNVVCSPDKQHPFRGLPRVLVVSPYLPFPLSHGGAVRMYNLCRSMSSQIDFVLACFRESVDTVRYDELHEVFRQVNVVDIDEKSPDGTVPKQVAEYRNSAMSDLIQSLSSAGGINLVQLEYTQMAEYRKDTAGVPVILVEHDLTFTLYEQLANAPGSAQQEARREYERWLSFERAALASVDTVWAMSDRDRVIAIENGAPENATFAVPNGVDLRRFQPVRRQTQERSVLFVGSFRHLPNLLAFEVLRETIMPEVWKVLPDVKLNVIAGPQHEQAAKAAKKMKLLAPDPKIRISGFVEDVRPAYRECDLAVIPLPVSAGTNIKLMEAMACGRAVVSTPVGCQGLGLQDETDLLIRDTGPEFATAIIRLLRDDETRLRIAARSRIVAETQFSWDSIAESALRSYAALLGEKAPQSEQRYG